MSIKKSLSKSQVGKLVESHKQWMKLRCMSAACASKHHGIEQDQVSWENSQRLEEIEEE